VPLFSPSDTTHNGDRIILQDQVQLKFGQILDDLHHQHLVRHNMLALA